MEQSLKHKTICWNGMHNDALHDHQKEFRNSGVFSDHQLYKLDFHPLLTRANQQCKLNGISRIWARAWQNQQNDLCDQQRLRSVFAVPFMGT